MRTKVAGHIHPVIQVLFRRRRATEAAVGKVSLVRLHRSSHLRILVAFVIHRSVGSRMFAADMRWGRASYIHWACNRWESSDTHLAAVVPTVRTLSVRQRLLISLLHRAGISLAFLQGFSFSSWVGICNPDVPSYEQREVSSPRR